MVLRVALVLAAFSASCDASRVATTSNPTTAFLHQPVTPVSLSVQRLNQPVYGGEPAGLGGNTPVVPTNTWVKPRVFFLFLVYDRIQHETIWDSFFSSAVQSLDYRAFVHCKSEASCRNNIQAQGRYEIIPSVETTYCFNLVNGMNALLRAALTQGGPGNIHDKFVFVSDSTIPVKSFAFMQKRLTVDTGAVSDFCIFPRGEWAEVTEASVGPNPPITHAAVKHHQWILLSREHAELSIAHAHELQDLMTTFQLNMGFRNTGCLDEFWHFATVYRWLNLTGVPASFMDMQGLQGSPLNTASGEIQGHCDTFVHWLPRASGNSNNITHLAEALIADAGTEMTPVSEKRPSTITRLSHSSIAILRDSDFLFARKLDEAAVLSGCGELKDAFHSIIFSTQATPLPQPAVTWQGQGMWRDNRQLPVTITSLKGMLRLTGADKSMKAKGSYCGLKIEVEFFNGFRQRASLSADSQLLHWDNGVVWSRTPR